MRKMKKIIPIAMIGLSLFLFPLDVLAAEGKTSRYNGKAEEHPTGKY
ncbi:hypothetical protein P3T75_06080 [Enterococcus montenegrensis]|nr:hypothetical protein [Enterococcus montenegrensis]WHA10374.1 hypothetical protein P3T75_06080 [Enterococcus montenegrensis]